MYISISALYEQGKSWLNIVISMDLYIGALFELNERCYNDTELAKLSKGSDAKL